MTIFQDLMQTGILAADIVFGLVSGFLAAVIWKWPQS